MARPITTQLAVASTENTHQIGSGLKSILIKNQGTTDCYIEFDRVIDTARSYLLEAGEAVTIESPFIRLYFKTASGTTTLYLLKILQ